MKDLFELRDDFCKDCQEPRCTNCHVLVFVKSISENVNITEKR